MQLFLGDLPVDVFVFAFKLLLNMRWSPGEIAIYFFQNGNQVFHVTVVLLCNDSANDVACD